MSTPIRQNHFRNYLANRKRSSVGLNVVIAPIKTEKVDWSWVENPSPVIFDSEVNAPYTSPTANLGMVHAEDLLFSPNAVQTARIMQRLGTGSSNTRNIVP